MASFGNAALGNGTSSAAGVPALAESRMALAKIGRQEITKRTQFRVPLAAVSAAFGLKSTATRAHNRAAGDTALSIKRAFAL
jgi:hypothetical protein